MIRSVLLAGLAMIAVGCADISRIDPEDSAPRPMTTAPLTSDRSAVVPRTASPQPIFVDTTRPAEGAAAQAQIWRMTQQTQAVARIPPTEPVPPQDIDQLRQSRKHAETLAGAQAVPRPVLGAGSGNPVFAYPQPTVPPQLNRAITRARAAETSALTR